MPLTREEPEPKLSSLSFYHEMMMSSLDVGRASPGISILVIIQSLNSVSQSDTLLSGIAPAQSRHLNEASLHYLFMKSNKFTIFFNNLK